MTEVESMTREEIQAELIAMVGELAQISDDRAQAAPVIERRDALRAELARRPPSDDERRALERELVGLRARLDRLVADRPSIAAMNDGGESQGGMAEVQEFVWKYDASTGLRQVAERVREIERRLRLRPEA